MPPGNPADQEIDDFLAGSADKLPVVKTALPKVSQVKDLVPSADADKEVEALLAAAKGPRPATKAEADSGVMPEHGKVTELPTQEIKGEVPQPEKPWYSKLLGHLGFPEQPKGFVPGDPNTDPNYAKEAAGLQHMQNVAAHPGWNLAADTAQPLAMAVPGGVGAQALAGGALNALNAKAEGQPALPAAERGAVLGGALAAGGQALSAAAKKAAPFADRLMTQVFMTPAQRAIYARQHGGSEALSQLGADARSAGLYKPANWLDYLHPTTARRVAENAERVQGETGQTINEFEDQLAQKGVNPDVQVAPIARGLREEAASKIEGVADPKAARDAAHFTSHADLLERPEAATVSGEATSYPGMRDYAPPPIPPRPAPPSQEVMQLQAHRPLPPPYQPGSLTGKQLPMFGEGQGQLSLGRGPRQMELPMNPETQVPGQLRHPEPLVPLRAPIPPQTSAQQLSLGPQQMELPVGTPNPPAPLKLPDLPKPPEQMSMNTEPVKTPLEAQAQIARETMPFTEAMKNKRYMANQIKWGQNPNAPGVDYGEDAARRFVWSGLKQNIGKALGQAANEGQIDKAALANYVKANKDFSTAATVQQPAMRMAERAGETGLGLSDLMAGASFGAPTAVASRFARGMAPSTIAAGVRGGGAFAEGMGKAMSIGARIAPIAQAQQQHPGAPKAVVEKVANDSLKDQVKNWFDSLLK